MHLHAHGVCVTFSPPPKYDDVVVKVNYTKLMDLYGCLKSFRLGIPRDQNCFPNNLNSIKYHQGLTFVFFIIHPQYMTLVTK